MSFGEKLKALRKGNGMTQQRLAEDVGVSRIYIQALESNRRTPSMGLLHRISETLQSSLSDLVEDIAPRNSRMQLDHVLSGADIDVWFRKHKLTDDERRRVERVIKACLDDWDGRDENAGTSERRRGRPPKQD